MCAPQSTLFHNLDQIDTRIHCALYCALNEYEVESGKRLKWWRTGHKFAFRSKWMVECAHCKLIRFGICQSEMCASTICMCALVYVRSRTIKSNRFFFRVFASGLPATRRNNVCKFSIWFALTHTIINCTRAENRVATAAPPTLSYENSKNSFSAWYCIYVIILPRRMNYKMQYVSHWRECECFFLLFLSSSFHWTQNRYCASRVGRALCNSSVSWAEPFVLLKDQVST